MKKAFTRTCIACNSKNNKFNLIKIAYNKNKELSIDTSCKSEGRGFYLCYNLDCLNKMIKTKKLEKRLKITINENFYENIRGVIIDKEKSTRNDENKNVGGDI